MNTYVVAFTLKQRGSQTSWLEHVLLSGIRDGEALENLQIVDLTEYFSDNSQNLTEDTDK